MLFIAKAGKDLSMKNDDKFQDWEINNVIFQNLKAQGKKTNQELDCDDYDGIEKKTCRSHDYDEDLDELKDCCEIHGFTIEDNQLVRWSDLRHKDKGFIKYFANPDLKSSTGDPYLDGEKAMRKIDPSILPEAHHPLVAACPEIIVYLEKIVLSKNFTLSDEKSESANKEVSKTVTTGTTNSHTHGQSLGAGFETEISAQGGASTTMNYGVEWNNSVTLDNSDAGTTSESKNKSWNQILNIDTSKTAFLNANIRYKNIGTAPIYECEPTLSFVLGQGKSAQTIATITAKKNAIANIVAPNQTYPLVGQNPLAFYTNDDFSWQSIILNVDQVQKLQAGEIFSLQLLQFSGNYSNVNAGGELVVESGSLWKEVFPSIYGRTACITLFLDNDVILRRRVAAKNLHELLQKRIPEFTISEAIAIAFSQVKFDEKNLTISFDDGESLLIDYMLFQTHDGLPIEKITNQTNLFNQFKTIIRPGMNISIFQKSWKETKKHQDKIKLEQHDLLLKHLAQENDKNTIEIYDYDLSWNELVQKQINQVKNKFKINDNFSISDLVVEMQDFRDTNNDKNQKISDFLKDNTYWESTFILRISFVFADLPKTNFFKRISISYFDYQLVQEFKKRCQSFFERESGKVDKNDLKKIFKEIFNDQRAKNNFIYQLQSQILEEHANYLTELDWTKFAWLKWLND